MAGDGDGPTVEDVKAILGIFRESAFAEMRLEMGATRLLVRKDGAAVLSGPGDASEAFEASEAAPARAPSDGPAPPASASGAAPGESPTEGLLPEGVAAVTAPVSGVFYRAPSPGAEPFVEIGQRVEAGTTVCLLEVMKLFNSIPAGMAGTVEEILPGDGASVVAGQPLVLIRLG